jgi:hypothetical protein
MANNPLDYNKHYKPLFSVRNTDNNDNIETVILYERINCFNDKTESRGEHKYVLARYSQNESTYPFKIFHKFSDLIMTEISEIPVDLRVGNSYIRSNTVQLHITTVYSNQNNMVTQRFQACRGSLLFTQQLETELFKVFFN